MTPLRIGTRASALALWQANHVADRLRAACSRHVILVEIETAGDQVRDVPLPEIGGEGVFTKAIQLALLDRTVDVAVQSLKDLPTIPGDGLILAAVAERGPTGDAFVSRKFTSLAALPAKATLATSSTRRKSQILHRRPDLRLVDIRSNVETRIRKMAEGAADGLVLAEAGLTRLGLRSEIREVLDPAWMHPAVGQGALGLECRADDADTHAILRSVDHAESHHAVLAERSLLRALGGGCQMPVGAVTNIDEGRLSLRAAVVSPDGKRRIENRIEGAADKAEEIGRDLASQLIAQGARELLFSAK